MSASISLKNTGGYVRLVVCYQARRATKNTGYKIEERYWNPNKQCVRSNYPNYSVINAELNKQLQDVILMEEEYIRLGRDYDASMLLSDSKVKNYSLVKDIIDEICVGKAVSTVDNYRFLMNSLCEFTGKSQKTLFIFDLSESELKRYAAWLEQRNCSTQTIRGKLGLISSIWNKAIELKAANKQDYPFDSFRYNRIYSSTKKNTALKKEHMKMFFEYFKSMDKERMFDRFTKEYSVAMFCNGFLLQGLAFVDMAALKYEQITQKLINGKNYYIINTRRQKTKQPVKIVLDAEDELINECFVPFMYTTDLRNNYLYPVYHKPDLTPKQKDGRISDTTKMVNKNLKLVANELNEKIKNNGALPWDESAYIPEDITYYTCRHTFASLSIADPNVSVGLLAQMLGRSIQNIDTYINQITPDEEIVLRKPKLL